jgi:hypothetical protein
MLTSVALRMLCMAIAEYAVLWSQHQIIYSSSFLCADIIHVTHMSTKDAEKFVVLVDDLNVFLVTLPHISIAHPAN